MKIWNTETHLGAVCNCNGVFTIYFFGVVFFVDGGRGKGGTLSMNMNVQVTVSVRHAFKH